MPTVEATESGQRCLEGAMRGVAWLLSQQNADGSWKLVDHPAIDGFYKAGWAFSLMGQAAAAERALGYVKRHFLDAEGDLSTHEHPWHVDVHYLYANAWTAIGAQKMGRYEIAGPALQFMLSQQDSTHGGFYSRKTAPGQRGRSDTMSTGICGIASLSLGQLEVARKVADCFERMIELQPAPAKRFYATIEADGKLGTDFPEDESTWRVISALEKDQCWYAVGLPFSFSILLSEATGEKRYLGLAHWFFDFQSHCVNPWDGGSSGKAGWGCSMLYRITGVQRYRDIALQVARNLLNWQSPEGWFDLGNTQAYGSGQERQFGNGDFDLVAEFVVWLGLIGSNLLGRDAV